METIAAVLAWFSVDLTHHALHALGSRALGFTQEMYDDSEPPDDDAMMASLEQAADGGVDSLAHGRRS